MLAKYLGEVLRHCRVCSGVVSIENGAVFGGEVWRQSAAGAQTFTRRSSRAIKYECRISTAPSPKPIMYDIARRLGRINRARQKSAADGERPCAPRATP